MFSFVAVGLRITRPDGSSPTLVRVEDVEVIEYGNEVLVTLAGRYNDAYYFYSLLSCDYDMTRRSSTRGVHRV